MENHRYFLKLPAAMFTVSRSSIALGGRIQLRAREHQQRAVLDLSSRSGANRKSCVDAVF